MADKVIGKDCTYESVCNAFQNSRAYKLPLDQWIRVQNELIPSQITEKLADEIEVGVSTIYNAYRTVLHEWRKINENGATLGVLVNVFERCGLDDAADEVREIFGLPPKPLALDLSRYDKLLQENHQFVKEHVAKNIGGLSRNTNLSEDLLKKLLEQGVITKLEIESNLNTATSDRAKNVRFYNLLMKKPQNYNKVLALLEEDKQVKALWILQRFYRHHPKTISVSISLHNNCKVF